MLGGLAGDFIGMRNLFQRQCKCLSKCIINTFVGLAIPKRKRALNEIERWIKVRGMMQGLDINDMSDINVLFKKFRRCFIKRSGNQNG